MEPFLLSDPFEVRCGAGASGSLSPMIRGLVTIVGFALLHIHGTSADTNAEDGIYLPY